MAFNALSTFRCIDDFISLNNSRFDDFVDRIDPIELEITDTDRSASYLDLHLENDSEGRVITKHYDKRDDFNFIKQDQNINNGPQYITQKSKG
jgi:hypothetical protein